MFTRQLLRASTRVNTRFTIRQAGVRNASSYVEKATGLFNSAIYWGKVTVEVAKQVYAKEGLAPPSTQEVQTVYQTLYKQALEFVAAPKQKIESLINCAKSINKDQGIRYGSYFIQLVGLYTLGEMIGRRQIVGYPSFGPKPAHH
ncbi:hypothetical protein B5S28_g1275 [[Candida] boidinii]|uniref:Unnamed protein product n=1 Tax=Candida boidinii TaxID=5477 RepID=A0ACB5U0Y7_CANBO|nr:hypothetical protein B5S28_g1275 [[Candida] boidinii]OWB61826.1 hypothetical protein B5S29_g2729 [[Candida] boidinii]OWB72692.1 hypothetical protein B5S31_g2411 [[Candida] boidinii]OWB77733.1 hypothetical protein B5S32_g1908 [[Candida] boidinii]GME68538.1 unnamed protein product [[Candida] boidinii]